MAKLLNIMTDTSKNPVTSVRLPELTRRQIVELTERYAMSMANVLTIAIDRMYQTYQQEQNNMTRTPSHIHDIPSNKLFRLEPNSGFGDHTAPCTRQQLEEVLADWLDSGEAPETAYLQEPGDGSILYCPTDEPGDYEVIGYEIE